MKRDFGNYGADFQWLNNENEVKSFHILQKLYLCH